MSSSIFTGTGRLLLLAIRLDRVRLTAWTLGMAALVMGTLAAVIDAYPDAASRIGRVVLGQSPGAALLTGPVFGSEMGPDGQPTDPGLGAIASNELGIFALVLVAVMSILLVVRHTRGDEQAGRTELIRALPTGRAAPATAGLGLALLANLLVMVATWIVLVAFDLAVGDSFAFALSFLVTGLVFGTVAAAIAQLTEHSRSATSLSLAVLGICFFLRGAGDVADPEQGSTLTWLSPLGWAQQIRVYADLRLWPLALGVVLSLVLLVVAAALAARRDLGRGLLPDRRGRSVARPALGTSFGLAARLLRGTLVGWALAIFVLGVVFGSLTYAIEDMADSAPQLVEWMGGSESLVNTFAAMLNSFVATGVVALGVSALLDLKSEERSGRVEHLLSFGAGRLTLYLGWTGVVAIGVVFTQVVGALGLGLGTVASTGDASWLATMLGAGLALVPAVLSTVALAAALLGLAPRVTWLAWVLVGWIAIVTFLGELLNLPEAVADLSPVSYSPFLPAEDMDAVPVLVLSGVALALFALGAWGFRRRDIQSN